MKLMAAVTLDFVATTFLCQNVFYVHLNVAVSSIVEVGQMVKKWQRFF